MQEIAKVGKYTYTDLRAFTFLQLHLIGRNVLIMYVHTIYFILDFSFQKRLELFLSECRVWSNFIDYFLF